MAVNIKIAKTAGFCPGVSRAVKLAYELVENENGAVFTLGPLIHNESVVEELESMGVHAIGSLCELEDAAGATVVIRSHGIDRKTEEELGELGVKIADATCPFVKKIHRIVESAGRDGRTVVIVGDREHPEVKGISGWCTGEAYIIGSESEAEELPPLKKVTVVSQTTLNKNFFSKAVEKIKEKCYDTQAINTICNATLERQTEAERLAAGVDAMIVIGGYNSSNTQKLFSICKAVCPRTYYVRDAADFALCDLRGVQSVGMTAGASTPGKIIEEIFEMMSEESFEQLLNEEVVNQIHTGSVVKGTVIGVKENEISMNIGYKSDGIITKSEYTNDTSVDLKEVVHVGDQMDVKVLRLNDGEGQVLLSYKRLAQDRSFLAIEEAFENKTVLTGKVAQVMTGGLTVNCEGARVFIPASLVSDGFERNLNKYDGQDVEFVVIEYNPKRRRIVGDRKQVVTERKAAAQKEFMDRISEGMIVNGKVKNLTDFGAFIDLGGADGLLHVSEMTWGRIDNPKKLFKVGDEIEAFIKGINGDKIALSVKFPDKNPWADPNGRYGIGNVVTGKVARMTDFGAFVELEPGVDALLHVSQISSERVEKPQDILTIGQEVTAKVVDFIPEEHKISLSIKAMEMDAPRSDNEAVTNMAEALENVTVEEAAVDVADAPEDVTVEEAVTDVADAPENVTAEEE